MIYKFNKSYSSRCIILLSLQFPVHNMNIYDSNSQNVTKLIFLSHTASFVIICYAFHSHVFILLLKNAYL